MKLDIPALEARCRATIEPGPYREEFDRAGRTSDIVEGLAQELGLSSECLEEGFLRGAALAFNLAVDDALVSDRFRWLVNTEPCGGFIVWDIMTGNPHDTNRDIDSTAADGAAVSSATRFVVPTSPCPGVGYTHGYSPARLPYSERDSKGGTL